MGPKKSCSVTVEYTPSAAGANDTATMSASSKKTAANTSLTLTGTGAGAGLRTVTLDFTVTVPVATDGTGLSVYIAGTLDRLDPPGPQGDPGVVLTRVDSTHWTVTLHGKETTQLEYKYTLGGTPEHVEKDVVCGELPNRQLTISYGASGTQTVNDTVTNWRLVPPCGN